jgi:acyl carrier protein
MTAAPDAQNSVAAEPEPRSSFVATIDLRQFREDVYAVLAKLSRTPVERIAGNHRLGEDLNLDSLKRMEALSRICDKYDLEPDVEKAMEFQTVDDILRLTESDLRQP